MDRCLKELKQFSDVALLEEAEQIIKTLKAAADFRNLAPAINNIRRAKNSYHEVLEGSTSETHAYSQKEKTNARNLLEELLCIYHKSHKSPAELIAHINQLSIKSAGKKNLTKAENFKISPGPVKGSVRLSLEVIEGAEFYNYQFTALPLSEKSEWQTIISKRRSILLEGLKSKKYYAFRVAGAVTSAALVWSEIITSIIS